MTATGKSDAGRGGAAKDRARRRLEAVGALVSVVSHRARNRMASVRAVLELLEAGMEGHMPQEQRIGALREFNALIDDFDLRLDLVRCGFGALETMPAHAVAEEALLAVRPVAERRGIELHLDGCSAADFVRADRLLLRQAILNLLLHATVALGGSKGRRIAVATAVAGPRVCIDVAGAAIAAPGPPRESPYPDPGDDGLGLTICRDAMTLMGGSMRSLSAKGSPEIRFRLSLPLVHPK